MRFLLVDRILELEPLQRILASKYVSAGEDYFQDHFPGYPIVPGVLLVEMIAQAIGKCVIAGLDKSLWPVFLQIRQANFRKVVPPDSSLLIEGFIEKTTEKTVSARGRILLNQETAAEVSVLFGFIPRNLLAPDFEDQVLKDYLRK